MSDSVTGELHRVPFAPLGLPQDLAIEKARALTRLGVMTPTPRSPKPATASRQIPSLRASRSRPSGGAIQSPAVLRRLLVSTTRMPFFAARHCVLLDLVAIPVTPGYAVEGSSALCLVTGELAELGTYLRAKGTALHAGARIAPRARRRSDPPRVVTSRRRDDPRQALPRWRRYMLASPEFHATTHKCGRAAVESRHLAQNPSSDTAVAGRSTVRPADIHDSWVAGQASRAPACLQRFVQRIIGRP
jgi:hypothetical protein